MRKIIFIFFVLLTSCKLGDNLDVDYRNIKKGQIIVYKHFAQCGSKEESFFENNECKALYHMYNPTIYDFIAHFNNRSNNFEKAYAFLFLNNGEIDTLYADRNLNDFMLISKKNKMYYSIERNLEIPFLNVIKYDQMDTFFNDCW